MKANENVKFTILDGSSEEQKKSSEAFLNSLTKEEHERAMTSEFDYLEEE